MLSAGNKKKKNKTKQKTTQIIYKDKGTRPLLSGFCCGLSCYCKVSGKTSLKKFVKNRTFKN